MYGPAKSVVESSRIYKQSSRIKANAKDQKNVTHSENIVCAVCERWMHRTVLQPSSPIVVVDFIFSLTLCFDNGHSGAMERRSGRELNIKSERAPQYDAIRRHSQPQHKHGHRAMSTESI